MSRYGCSPCRCCRLSTRNYRRRSAHPFRPCSCQSSGAAYPPEYSHWRPHAHTYSDRSAYMSCHARYMTRKRSLSQRYGQGCGWSGEVSPRCRSRWPRRPRWCMSRYGCSPYRCCRLSTRNSRRKSAHPHQRHCCLSSGAAYPPADSRGRPHAHTYSDRSVYMSCRARYMTRKRSLSQRYGRGCGWSGEASPHCRSRWPRHPLSCMSQCSCSPYRCCRLSTRNSRRRSAHPFRPCSCQWSGAACPPACSRGRPHGNTYKCRPPYKSCRARYKTRKRSLSQRYVRGC